MNVKNSLALVFLFSGILYGFSQRDSIVLKKIRVAPDTVIEGVRGIGISYVANLGYDTTYHLRKFPSAIKLVFELNSKGRPVECYGSSSKFCKKDSFYYVKDLSFGLSRPEMVLIPYYALKLPEGNNSVSLVLTGLVGDTSIFDRALHSVPVIGTTNHSLLFVKPPVDRFEVLVNGVKMMGTDFNPFCS